MISRLLFLLFIIAPLTCSAQSLNPFHGADLSALDQESRTVLQRAGKDFELASAGRMPRYAKLDTVSPIPSDGGTSYWIGQGYKITIAKELVSFGNINGDADGFLYGPILVIDKKYAVGNSSNPTFIRFYTFDQFDRLVNRKRKP